MPRDVVVASTIDFTLIPLLQAVQAEYQARLGDEDWRRIRADKEQCKSGFVETVWPHRAFLIKDKHVRNMANVPEHGVLGGA
ncbi:MAG: hypothetical protein V7751_09410 [Pseudoalteromonas distincta]